MQCCITNLQKQKLCELFFMHSLVNKYVIFCSNIRAISHKELQHFLVTSISCAVKRRISSLKMHRLYCVIQYMIKYVGNIHCFSLIR